MGQLQSKLQNDGVNTNGTGENVPQSWKWENQLNINDRRERKGKRNKKTVAKKNNEKNDK